MHLRQFYRLQAEDFRGGLSEGKVDRFLQTKDPYSDYLSREEFKNFEKETNQEYVGIGVQITRLEAGISVTRVFPDSPAQKAGLLPGDIIKSVGDEEVSQASVSEVVQLITGPEGTRVEIRVLRPGAQESLTLVPERRSIQYPTITGVRFVADGIGYLKIEEFARKTAEEFDTTLDRLESKGLEGLVIDLRNNPGGMLDSAVDISGQFLEKGTPIVEIRSLKKKQPELLRSRSRSRAAKYPIVLLLNRGSASASEIVAGTLRSTKKAVILGEPSYGKGSVQSIFALSNGEGLRMTTARYYFPDGSSIEEGVGLIPDIEVKLESSESYQLRLQEFHRDMLDEDEFRERFGVDPIEDRQLIEAVRYLQGLELRS